MKSVSVAVALMAAFFVSGCDAFAPLADGYQFGDATKTYRNVKEYRQEMIDRYCAATTAQSRQEWVTRIQEEFPGYKAKCPKDHAPN